MCIRSYQMVSDGIRSFQMVSVRYRWYQKSNHTIRCLARIRSPSSTWDRWTSPGESKIAIRWYTLIWYQVHNQIVSLVCINSRVQQPTTLFNWNRQELFTILKKKENKF